MAGGGWGEKQVAGLGVNLVGSISNSPATPSGVHDPSLHSLGFLSFPTVEQLQAAFGGSLEPETAQLAVKPS